MDRIPGWVGQETTHERCHCSGTVKLVLKAKLKPWVRTVAVTVLRGTESSVRTVTITG